MKKGVGKMSNYRALQLTNANIGTVSISYLISFYPYTELRMGELIVLSFIDVDLEKGL